MWAKRNLGSIFNRESLLACKLCISADGIPLTADMDLYNIVQELKRPVKGKGRGFQKKAMYIPCNFIQHLQVFSQLISIHDNAKRSLERITSSDVMVT